MWYGIQGLVSLWLLFGAASAHQRLQISTTTSPLCTDNAVTSVVPISRQIEGVVVLPDLMDNTTFYECVSGYLVKNRCSQDPELSSVVFPCVTDYARAGHRYPRSRLVVVSKNVTNIPVDFIDSHNRMRYRQAVITSDIYLEDASEMWYPQTRQKRSDIGEDEGNDRGDMDPNALDAKPPRGRGGGGRGGRRGRRSVDDPNALDAKPPRGRGGGGRGGRRGRRSVDDNNLHQCTSLDILLENQDCRQPNGEVRRFVDYTDLAYYDESFAFTRFLERNHTNKVPRHCITAYPQQFRKCKILDFLSSNVCMNETTGRLDNISDKPQDRILPCHNEKGEPIYEDRMAYKTRRDTLVLPFHPLDMHCINSAVMQYYERQKDTFVCVTDAQNAVFRYSMFDHNDRSLISYPFYETMRHFILEDRSKIPRCVGDAAHANPLCVDITKHIDYPSDTIDEEDGAKADVNARPFVPVRTHCMPVKNNMPDHWIYSTEKWFLCYDPQRGSFAQLTMLAQHDKRLQGVSTRGFFKLLQAVYEAIPSDSNEILSRHTRSLPDIASTEPSVEADADVVDENKDVDAMSDGDNNKSTEARIVVSDYML